MAISSKSYLRQYGFFGLVGSSLGIYAKYFVPLVAVVVIVVLPPLFLIDVFMHLFPKNPDVLVISFLLEVIALWTGLLAVVAEISDICLGNELSVGRALRRVNAGSIFQLFGTLFLSLCIPLFCFVPALLLELFAVRFPTSTIGTWLKLLGVAIALIGVLLCYYLCIRFSFAQQVVILEKKYWFQALRRSGQLVTRSWWRILGCWLLFSLLVYLPVFVISSGPGVIAAILRPQYSMILSLYQSLALVVTMPLIATFGTLFYYSERIRKHDLTAEELLEIKTFETV